MSLYLTRKVHFCASHRYHNPAFTAEENLRAFGKCVNAHGHNYLLEVTVQGEVDPATGLVIDLKALAALLDEVVMKRYDHKMLNLDVPELGHLVPTTENLVLDIWTQLASRLEGCSLRRLRLYEEPTLFVDYFGELHGAAT